MYVVATAGHVDHGKSTIVHALTGTDPDRWSEEHRRGLTIDLGFAWMNVSTGATLGFVDVPGHHRFITNMLAGMGPSPAIVMVVAADEGWSRQSTEHLAAADALGIEHGLIVVSKSDLADPGRALAEARERVERSSVGRADAIAVSARTGRGMAELTLALEGLVEALPAPDAGARVRLWVDRAFTVRGSGVVVTGTLGAGTVHVGDMLALGERTVRVRGLQSQGGDFDEVGPVRRVAVNLRGVDRHEVSRGDALLSPHAWPSTTELDVRLTSDAAELPGEAMIHVGSAAVAARIRPLDVRVARVRLARPLPLVATDRLLVRDPGRHSVTGALVLDADPPALNRRGAAAARAAQLAGSDGSVDLAAEVRRRGAVRRRDLTLLGVPLRASPDTREVGEWMVAEEQWLSWSAALRKQIEIHARRAPLEGGLPHEAARRAIDLPDRRLLGPLIDAAGLESRSGRIRSPGASPRLGGAESAVRLIEERLNRDPLDAPTIPELADLGLGSRELAAAAATGRLVRLKDDVVLLPDGPAKALAVVAELSQPFTASEARRALVTTRRVVIPLLEHMDRCRWTRRVDDQRREVIDGARA